MIRCFIVGTCSTAWRRLMSEPPLRFLVAIGVLLLLGSRPPAAYAHGQGVPFAFWGDFPSQAARCQNVLAYAATRCANRVWKFHTDCFNALLDGNVCGVSILVDPVQSAHLDSLNVIDVLCTSPEVQALGFLLKYEAQTDMNNFCYAIENALVSAVYGPVMNGHPPDDRTRTCVEAMARATTKLWRFAVRARRRALDEIARRNMTPGDKQALIAESSMVIQNLQALIQKKLEAECVTTDFTATYHHDDSELLTLVGERADCLAAAVYVQNAVFCPLPVCGNGMQEVGEQCDDGNLVDGDGCSGDCTVETTTPP